MIRKRVEEKPVVVAKKLKSNGNNTEEEIASSDNTLPNSALELNNVVNNLLVAESTNDLKQIHSEVADQTVQNLSHQSSLVQTILDSNNDGLYPKVNNSDVLSSEYVPSADIEATESNTSSVTGVDTKVNF